jgi:hypothetical protein
VWSAVVLGFRLAEEPELSWDSLRNRDGQKNASGRVRRLWALGLALGSLWVYCMTLYPSIAGGDAAEFSFVACGPGIAHPPGDSPLPSASNLRRASQRFGFQRRRGEKSRPSPPHRPREDGFTHPTGTSRPNLAAALGLLSKRQNIGFASPSRTKPQCGANCLTSYLGCSGRDPCRTYSEGVCSRSIVVRRQQAHASWVCVGVEQGTRCGRC